MSSSTSALNILPPRRPWAEHELELLRQRYTDTPTQMLADALGRTVDQVYRKADSLRLKKSAEYLAGPHAQRLRCSVVAALPRPAPPVQSGTPLPVLQEL